MGIRMQVFLAPDSDLRAFAIAPRTLQMWLRYPHARPPVSLTERWRDLDQILATDPELRDRPPLRPQGGDYTYPFVADRGAHALSSPSTEVLLRALQRIGRPEVEAYVRSANAGGAVSAEAPEEEVATLLDLLGRLREMCTYAFGKGYGLLMALWGEP